MQRRHQQGVRRVDGRAQPHLRAVAQQQDLLVGRGSAGTRIASWAASSSRAAARDSSVAVNGHARPSRTCPAPIRSVCDVPARGARPPGRPAARAASWPPRSGRCPDRRRPCGPARAPWSPGRPARPRRRAPAACRGCPRAGSRRRARPGRPPTAPGRAARRSPSRRRRARPTTCSEMMLQPARPTAVASSPSLPGRSSSSTCTRHSTTSSVTVRRQGARARRVELTHGAGRVRRAPDRCASAQPAAGEGDLGGHVAPCPAPPPGCRGPRRTGSPRSRRRGRPARRGSCRSGGSGSAGRSPRPARAPARGRRRRRSAATPPGRPPAAPPASRRTAPGRTPAAAPSRRRRR